MYGPPVREGRVTAVITARMLLGRLGLHRPGLVLICLTGRSSQAHEGDGLTNYGAFGPFVRSFILLVDPGISVPHNLPYRQSTSAHETLYLLCSWFHSASFPGAWISGSPVTHDSYPQLKPLTGYESHSNARCLDWLLSQSFGERIGKVPFRLDVIYCYYTHLSSMPT
jgi:hypothetical protein